ncbi:predicted protein [Micromonas commoda]|uniref:Solanesyl diphosphate synthase n=1 Tax=Micromonas commoda (strain RCC299 / NOUM17 / CCMP2709) TaxID=296587 RepID=C1E716_MICCC|nr:predicted protein [Micromonas commoda]ACO63901.1 predicted protein [Micromonas commoda]|eukprot:XP_002502643.1 predicted protein [Micromonas commoda]
MMSAVVGAGAGAARAVAGAAAGEGRMTARARASTNGGSAAGWRVARWGEGRPAGRSRVSGGVGGGFSGAALGGAGRAGADKSTAAVAVNGKRAPSIDEMDMDPEHVKFASQDELDQSEIMKCKDGVCTYVIDDIIAPVKSDMEQMRSNILDIVGRKNPLLLAAADQIFGAGGKRLRPVLVFLVARATAQLMSMDDITERQRRLAEITEMIHTASLVHDDVLDDCDTRRGAETIHTLYGTRVAILAGDFLFAQSSWYLANLDNLEVIKLISQVIADFADGEISQAGALFNCDVTLEGYLEKSHNKTASLIAASCKSAAVFSEVSEDVKMDMYEYGKHLGLAFQIVDDILDFTQSEAQLGKPKGQDLASGNLTAPCIFALGRNPRLRELIETQFANPEDLAEAIEIVNESGIEDARRLAREEADMALAALKGLPEGKAKTSLVDMVGYVLERLY